MQLPFSELATACLRGASEEEKPLAGMMVNAEVQAQLHSTENTTVFIYRGKKLYLACHFRKLVITFFFVPRAVSPKSIGYSLVMETDKGFMLSDSARALS